mmetsp:Transcript_115025/g.321468  ORF Transcript_115025/g.321468 Transcript_115025/m.321468 type:complete len:390 (+) Transcript_115025:67-1236(+)
MALLNQETLVVLLLVFGRALAHQTAADGQDGCSLIQTARGLNPLRAAGEVGPLGLQLAGAVAPSGPYTKVAFNLFWDDCSGGQLGNLMFEWASLLGLADMVGGPGAQVCYKAAAFGKSRDALNDAFGVNRSVPSCGERTAAPGCKISMKETRHTMFESEGVANLTKKLGALTRSGKCDEVSVTVGGCFQSWKYFDAIRPQVVKLFTPPAAARDDAQAWLRAARTRLSAQQPGGGWRFVGVQVRLGDKEHNSAYAYYAPTSWSYFKAGMRHAEEQLLARHPGDQVAFVVTVGGNAEDLETTKRALAGDLGGRLLFTEAATAMVDFAVLSSADALVISVSTFGWWAAYTSRSDVVVAPRHIYKPNTKQARKGVSAADAYPRDWKLLDNLSL